MKKQKNIMPVQENDFDKFNTVSYNECTGLITVPPQDDEELENYMEVCDFGPPIVHEEHKQ